ncbi:MAG: isoprenylcysteine carboxylmethyltransferase family protein [Eubacterium sp.]|nr:isoprenylcysteine carboxylmethyltransferase family protein [Eubacterium sp.]
MEDIKETNNDIPENDIYNLDPIVATSKQKYPYRSAAFYVAVGSFIMTALSILICILTGFLSNGITTRTWERCVYIVFGAVLIFFAYVLFSKAKNDSKIENAVIHCRLITDGVYAYVRNPMDTAVLFVNAAVLFFYGNVYLYSLLFIYWIAFTIVLKKTEELWLRKEFGKDYAIYYDSVGRLIPLKPGSRK